ncbi:MAG TPA: VWA domain-containing protein [Verrucomicrobia bacterium]|nr:VWA domain-containing protein [Verrucomicrobiota bacterium]HOB32528.1 VWA domain-containing protein [Verrucomicrobiota bacterium]HOP98924.1 VWA domain-containing protein [Verrucomicrobiota bacterium]
MKTTLLALALATGMVSSLPAAETLRLTLEPDRHALLKGSTEEVVIKIDLQAALNRKKGRRIPLNLAVVLDRSGSMTGAKIEKAKQAATQLVDQLAENDIFALISYSETAEVMVPAQKVDDKSALKRRIARIDAGGRTALHAGVTSGANQLREHFSAKRINRVILLSDGLANVGPSSTRELRQLGRELARDGIAVTTIGLGDDYNEDLMAALAEASDANYYYVKDTEKLPEIFARELGELLTIAAREVRIEVTCPDGVKPIGFIGRSEQFEGQRALVKLSHLTAGQTRALYLRCRVTEAQPEIAQVNVRYTDELDTGTEQSAAGAARVRYTADPDTAARSINAPLAAEKELILAAVTKDEALAACDAGNLALAAQKLESQARALEANLANCPVPLQAKYQAELENLREHSVQLQKGNFDASVRKQMQSESFLIRNSK